MTAATTSPIAGLEVTLVERLNQVMPLLDPEMARLVECSMVRHGVRLELNDGVAGFEQSADGALEVLTASASGCRRTSSSLKRETPGFAGGFEKFDRSGSGVEPTGVNRSRFTQGDYT